MTPPDSESLASFVGLVLREHPAARKFWVCASPGASPDYVEVEQGGTTAHVYPAGGETFEVVVVREDSGNAF